MSCNRVSINCTPRASRHTSFTWSSPPKDRRARLVASSRVMPEVTYFSTRCSKWNRSSSSNSVSAAFRLKRERRRWNKSLSIKVSLNRLEHLGYGSRQLFTDVLFHFELLASAFCEFVILRSPVVL